MPLLSGNLLSQLPHLTGGALDECGEFFEPLVEAGDVRLERIVSTGQATPAGTWLAQEWDEWVVLVAGEAGLLIEGESAPRKLKAGDWIDIPAQVRHRVEWTSREEPAIWLALHYRADQSPRR